MIDYSKFENIELSDDSDIEVHPNVDKRSFIKWKQRDIHEKRLQRNAQINQITVNLLMYSHLNDRVDSLLLNNGVDLSQESQAFLYLDSKFDKLEVFQSELVDANDTLPYNEQIEDLLIQLKNDLLKSGKEINDANIRDVLKQHKLKIDNLIVDQQSTLAKLKEEKLKHIESDDLREGFSSTIINKGGAQQTTTSKGKEQVIETINSPKPKDLEPKPSRPLESLAEMELLDETEEFSMIPDDDFNKMQSYLAQHLYIICEQQKDSLLMTLFDAELDGHSERAKSIVFKSILLRFLDELLKPIKDKNVKLSTLNTFFSRIRDKSHPASQAFAQEVNFTYEHIKTRSKVLKEEQANNGGDDEEEALIQLKSTDDSTQITVDLPQEDDTERYEIFKQLPQNLQEALKTENMDEVNKVFAQMKLLDAERCLDIMNEGGILGVVDLLENEEEFEKLKRNNHQNNLDELAKLEEIDEDDVIHHEPELSTADLVD